jgi:chorismate synthase
VVDGKTTGAPITIELKNRKKDSIYQTTIPRPGHADFAGATKYGVDDISLIAERASGRETAARVAIGAIAKLYLAKFNIIITSYVHQIGDIRLEKAPYPFTKHELSKVDIHELIDSTDINSMRCPDPKTDMMMRDWVKKAERKGDSVGGAFTVIAYNVPIGLGSHVQWDQKIDAQLSFALMSIQGIKGVQFSEGFEGVSKSGSEYHDAICYDNEFYRNTNSAGGVEGGMTNGEPIIIKCAVKPPSSLQKPLPSIDLVTKQPASPVFTRSDICFVPAAGVVGEAMVGLILSSRLYAPL